MKTSEIEIRDMLSVLSVQGVETRIGEVPGVESVTVNYAGGSATVRYDETRLNVADIKSAVRQGEYERSAAAGEGDEGGAGPGPADPAHAEAKPSAPPARPPGAAPATAEKKPNDVASTGAPVAPVPPKPSTTPPSPSAAPASAPEAKVESAPGGASPGGAEHDMAAMAKP
jgi:Cu2+-exporting ATPase